MLAFTQSLCEQVSYSHTSHVAWLMHHKNSFLKTVEAEKSETNAPEDLVSSGNHLLPHRYHECPHRVLERTFFYKNTTLFASDPIQTRAPTQSLLYLLEKC